MALAFPEPGVGPLAWVALAPLLVVTRGARPRRAALLGSLFGAAFFGVLIFWISIIGYLGWVLLATLQAVFVTAWALAWTRAGRLRTLGGRTLTAAASWVALEYLRARVPVGGFTWGQLAQSQSEADTLLPLAALTGGWGISFVVVAANVLAAEAWSAWRAGRRPLALAALGVAGACLLAPGLLPAPRAPGSPVTVAIVQGGTSEEVTPLGSRQASILASHARLTRALPAGVDLVVWPESSVELDLRTTPRPSSVLSRAARAAGAHLIAGVNDDVGNRRYRVMAFLVTPQGGIADVYQKNHLVPFGEYVPARPLLDWIPLLAQVPKDAVPGTRPGLFDLGDFQVATVISFEGDFGSLTRVPVALGGDLLVVATNTSTWRRSWASAQHLAFSRVRAAENGVWVVHGAISGISAFVAPDGTIAASSPLGQATTLVHTVRLARGATFYARTGDWFVWVCALVACIGLLAAPRRPREARRR